ncbi:MAG: hypothetical protein QXW80_03085 [Candidatus Micrarchaeia archaeon]|uniref:hypothetical protein n=1 Tax=Saccharolobus sp. TaxID=2100761 RepID=UPI0031800658
MNILTELSETEFQSFLAFIEDLPKLTEDLDKVGLVLSGIKNIVNNAEGRKLSEEDVKRIRSVCIRLLDSIDGLKQLQSTETRIQNLINKLEELLAKLEKYLEDFYKMYGYLPEYYYYDHRYYQRLYPYTKYYYYYKYKYPDKELGIKKAKAGFEFPEKIKDRLMEELTLPQDPYYRPMWDRNGDLTYKELLEHTVNQLQQKYEELRKQREKLELAREQALSDTDKILRKWVDAFLKREAESGRW